MSLEMLLPTRSTRSQKHNKKTPLRSQSQPASCITTSNTNTTSAYLENLSATFLTAINAQDFPLVTSMGALYFDSDMTSYIDDACFASNHAEYLQKTFLLMQQNTPRITCLARNVRAHVDEHIGLATVFISYEVTGWAAEMAELKRSSVGMMRWRKRDGQWKCFQSVTLRGMGMFEGEVP